MANTVQAAKRAAQSQARALHNSSLRSALRTSIKHFLKAVEAKNTDEAKKTFRHAASLADRLIHKKLVSRNRAARLKQRLNVRLKAMVLAA